MILILINNVVIFLLLPFPLLFLLLLLTMTMTMITMIVIATTITVTLAIILATAFQIFITLLQNEITQQRLLLFFVRNISLITCKRAIKKNFSLYEPLLPAQCIPLNSNLIFLERESKSRQNQTRTGWKKKHKSIRERTSGAEDRLIIRERQPGVCIDQKRRNERKCTN